jgi:hypothetical protein
LHLNQRRSDAKCTNARVIAALLAQVTELKAKRAALAFKNDVLEPMPLLPITSAQTVCNMERLNVDARTVFAVSYPKSGTTWLQHIIFTLCTKGKSELDHISNYAPFYESDGTWNADGTVKEHIATRHNSIGWRVFNTHCRW